MNSAKDIQALATQWQASRALLAAFELDLFSALGGDVLTGAEIAARAGTDPRATDRLLRAMVPLGLVELRGERFVNTGAARRWLDRASDECLTNLAHTAHTFKNWATLHKAVQAGTSVVGTDFDNEQRRADFIEAMHRRSLDQAEGLAGLIGLAGVRRVLDVGGGSGGNAIAFCRLAPDMTAVVLDRPSITSLTRDYVARAGLADRIAIMDGDYNEAEFGSGFDLVLFSAIVHINSPGQNLSLMERAARALNPGGRVAVSDFIMDDDRLSPPSGTLFALNMLVNTDCGDVYTNSEVRSWMEAAGLEPGDPVPGGPTTSLIVGKKD